MENDQLARARAAQMEIEERYPDFQPELLGLVPDSRPNLALEIMSRDDFIRWVSLDQTIQVLSTMS